MWLGKIKAEIIFNKNQVLEILILLKESVFLNNRYVNYNLKLCFYFKKSIES